MDFPIQIGRAYRAMSDFLESVMELEKRDKKINLRMFFARLGIWGRSGNVKMSNAAFTPLETK